MTTIPAFTSVPGQLVPGMGQPALIANEPVITSFRYYGHMILYYLDYLDVATGHTLVALPGGSYLMTPVNSRQGLGLPPPDGRWNPGTVRDLIVFHPAGSAAWDREAHRRLGGLPPLSLAEVRAAIGPGFVPPVLIPQQRDVIHVAHPPGSAAWDREAHATLKPPLAPGLSLAEARAQIGPGPVPPLLIPVQQEPAADPGPPRFQHQAPSSAVAPQPSLAEVRVAIEAAKAARGFWGTGPAVPQPAAVSGGKPMPPPEPTELQRIRAALAAKATVAA